ncbi:MAG: YicC/YloC family endoribonuclease [Thermovirgaceae bacterium]
MLKSMTGYSRVQNFFEWGTASLEISSVNHKYQDISIRLPKELSGAEPLLQKRLRSAFRRGKVLLRSDVCWSQAYRSCYVNSDILKAYVKDIQKAFADLGIERVPQIEPLLNLPGVLEPAAAKDAFSLEAMGKDMDSLLESALEDWNGMRAIEGGHLKEDILVHLMDLENRIKTLGKRWPEARDAAVNAFRERISTLLAGQGIALDEARVAQEIVILNDKWDITEEIARLGSHMAKFRDIMDNVEVSGKKLDFLVQEMNREVNTIASKSNDSTLRWEAVEAKATLESIREQIQNVE